MWFRAFLLLGFVAISTSHTRTHLGWYPIRATRGRPIPQPQSMEVTDDEGPITLLPYQFQIAPIGLNCDILSAAIARYFPLILTGESAGGGWPLPGSPGLKTPLECEARSIVLRKLLIEIDTPCDGGIYPTEVSDESYYLNVSPSVALIRAREVWGALRGLETFSQLVYRDPTSKCLQTTATLIYDHPRFTHRGLLLDTGRHFLTKNVLMRNLDAMSYAKLNVFHWHIVDDESFPYASTTFPNMTEKGAFSPSHVYSQEDIAELIEYARLRGIRVIPEFDTPGHSLSWGRGLPQLLTRCYSGGSPDGSLGPVDPTKSSSFEILKKLAEEWKKVFPDKYIHLGGDEVSFGCWQSNPFVKKFMQKKNITTYGQLENYYMSTLLDIVSSLGMKYIIWQDPLLNGVKPDPNTYIHVWLGDPNGWKDFVKNITSQGYKTILSSSWYISLHPNQAGWDPIQHYYMIDPQDFNGTQRQKDLVVGGEACMWGEFADSSNVLSNTWPNAFIVAERLWSSKETKDFKSVASRVFEMQCRLIHRGIPAAPIAGPGFCDKEWTET